MLKFGPFLFALLVFGMMYADMLWFRVEPVTAPKLVFNAVWSALSGLGWYLVVRNLMQPRK